MGVLVNNYNRSILLQFGLRRRHQTYSEQTHAPKSSQDVSYRRSQRGRTMYLSRCCQTNLNTRKRHLKSIIMRHRNWTTLWEQLYVFAWRIACFLDVFHGWSGYRFDCDNWQISEVPQPSWNAASLVLVVEMADVNFRICCWIGRRIIACQQFQSHEKPRRRMATCLLRWSLVIRAFALFLWGTSSLQPCCVAL